MRPKLTIPEQIKDMLDAGIAFDIYAESNAKRYLEYNTYYFKLKAYAKNYDKYINTNKKGQYINLDFAYLMDLYEIDTQLKKIILIMVVELEHFLKVKMLADFQKVDEDGYEIIQELFNMQPNLKEEIEQKINSSTCNEIISKYKDAWAIWNIVEVMTLGQFINLYGLFYARNKFIDNYTNMLLPIKMIRNAAAHGNCLINRLRSPYSRSIVPNYELKYELSQNVKISHKTLEKKLAHPAIHDFTVLLYLYSLIVPKTILEVTSLGLKDLFNNRMRKNANYYTKNQVILSSYDFVSKIVNFYC